MIPLPRPSRDYSADYEAISARRKSPQVRAQLTAVAPQVKSAYARYAASIDNYTSVLSTAPKSVKIALRSNFDLLDTGASFEFIRNQLLAEASGRCPLCAQGTPASLDHFLPKEHFPELSVLPSNLIPACERCNRLKQDKRHVPGGPRFLHAYFDRLPNEELLVAAVDTQNSVTVRFEIVRSKRGVDRKTLADVRYHFQELKLGKYYESEANVELFDRLAAIQMYFDAGGEEAVQAYLGTEHRSCLAKRGPNYWRTAFYLGLSRSDSFCSGAFQQLV